MTKMRMPSSDSKGAAIALLLVQSILWGSSFVSVKIGLEYVNVYDFVFLRLAITSIILMVVLIVSSRFKPTALRETSIWILGLLNGAAYALEYIGMIFTTAAKTALLINANVITVALLSWRMFEESFSYRKCFGVIAGVLGAAMITIDGDLSTLAHGELLGDLLAFAAGIIWAFFIVLHKRTLMVSRRSVVEISAVVMLATALLLSPLAVLFGGRDFVAISLQGWGWVMFIAVVCTVIPYAIWVFALKAVTATIATVVSTLEVVTTMALSSLLLGEQYGIVTLLGAFLVLFSILAVAQS